MVSYTTHAIILAIKHQSPISKPWFIENVGASAWGLAIHKEARLLAVSSNTHLIEVFAPALSTPEYMGVADTDHAARKPVTTNEQWIRTRDGISSQRSRHQRSSLMGHEHNVPNLAFCNTDLDPEGRFLVSTDIEDYTFVWDVYQGAIMYFTLGTRKCKFCQRFASKKRTHNNRPTRVVSGLSGSAHVESEGRHDCNVRLHACSFTRSE